MNCLLVLFTVSACTLAVYGQGNNKVIVFLEFQKDGVDGNLYVQISQRGLNEGIAVGQFVGQLQARSLDGVLTSNQIRYSVVGTKYLAVNSSGTVTTAQELDDENIDQDSLNVKFRAEYDGYEAAEVNLDITVNDVNDNYPTYYKISNPSSSGGHATTVSEFATVGSLIYSDMEVIDLDESYFSILNITCFVVPNDTQSEEACRTFRVEQTQDVLYTKRGSRYTVKVYLKQRLDYETRRSYVLTVNARDNAPKTGPNEVHNERKITIVIRVTDEQDTPPIFTQVSQTMSIMEESPIGTSIGSFFVQDGDTGVPRSLAINMIDTAGLFRLNCVPDANMKYKCDVEVNASIDREKYPSHKFTVTAFEIDSNGTLTNTNATTDIEITIRDLNDNAPKFSKQVYDLNVLETNTNGTLPGLYFGVTDPDQGTNSQFTVSIIQQTFDSVFRVEPSQGAASAQFSLFILKPEFLDYETPNFRTHQLVMKAVDDNDATLSSTATINLNVLDVNDNDPVFQQLDRYVQPVQETAPIGLSILTVSATDRDSPVYGTVSYQMTGTNVDTFKINATTGLITLAKNLDYEGINRYVLTIYALDNGTPPRQANIPLEVNVLDVNDIGPVFALAQYRTTVTETSTTFLIEVRVQATDAEGDPVRYAIVAGNTADNAFSVNSVTGLLSLSRKVNYDETPKNSGSTRPQGYFNLTVRASDDGAPPETSDATIIVEVIDANNQAPVFEKSLYNNTISEIQNIGTSVMKVSASDGDYGSNGEVRYFITSGALDHFVVDQASGDIITSGNALDYDENSVYNIVVEGIDRGSPPLSGSTLVLIKLTDANNKLPTFSQDIYYVENFPENSPINSRVVEVKAQDTDQTSRLEYSILRSTIRAKNEAGSYIPNSANYDFQSLFDINNQTGIITVNRELSYDQAAILEFSVSVRDLNAQVPPIQSATASVIVFILQVRNATPEFTKPWTQDRPTYTDSVNEEIPIGSTVKQFIVSVVGNNNPATFEEIPDLDVGNFFTVNSTSGVVTTTRRIDYEGLQNKFLKLRVNASVPGSGYATAEVTFNIKNINDNDPKFQKDSYTFVIPENEEYPRVIGTAFATDADNGSSADLFYSLSGTDAEKFAVFSKGAIAVAKGVLLDYETKQDYNLILRARDTFDDVGVYREASVRVKILLTDVNDNPPEFIFSSPGQTSFSFYTVETFIGQNLVGQVLATDRDSGSNGQVLFRLLDAHPEPAVSRYFGLSEQNGYLYTKISLDGASAYGQFNFTILAEDNGSPRRSNQVFAYINVSSGAIDDGRPKWTSPGRNEILTIREDTKNATNIYQALASPRTPGAIITYSFPPNNNYDDKFKIYTNGTIQTCGLLDREEREVYELIIIATDSLNTTLTSDRMLTVRLEDVDDNVPDFNNCPDRTYGVEETANVREGSPNNTFVYRAVACDLDNAPSNIVSYAWHNDPSVNCVESLMSKYFRLDASTGNIYTNLELDREDTAVHYLCVEARNASGSAGRRKRAATVAPRTYLVIRVNVLDLNDNGPYFPDQKTYFAIFERPKTTEVVKVLAIDPDSSFFNEIRFSLDGIMFQKGSTGRTYPVFGAFSINPTTGLVSVSFPTYENFLKGQFTLSIKAEDQKAPELFSTINIFVVVAEESNQVRLVTQTTNNANIVASVDKMISDIETRNNGYKVQRTEIRYHRDVTGAVINERTDVCMLIIKQQSVLDSYDGANFLSLELNSLSSDITFVEPGPCEPMSSSSLERLNIYWWVLIAFAIFMGVLILICIYAICIFFRNYKEYMSTQRQILVPQ